MVMMMRIRCIDLITAASIAELHFLENADFSQQVEAAVDRCQSDFQLVLAEDIMDILCAEVFATMIKENLQHRLALRRHLQLALLEAFFEIFHCELLFHAFCSPLHVT